MAKINRIGVPVNQAESELATPYDTPVSTLILFLLLKKARRVILELACVASVSMWFRSKERPRNGVEQDFLFRIERRLVRIHLCVEL